MLCKRVQLSSQGDWPEAHGVCFYRGNPLTYFCILGRLCRHMGLLKCLSITRVLFQNHNGVSAKSRDTRVGELWGLTSFFGYSTQTFVQAVNLLDRFLAIMKVRTLIVLVKKKENFFLMPVYSLAWFMSRFHHRYEYNNKV